MKMTSMRLGFLIDPLSFNFGNVRLEPVADHSKITARLENFCNADGFLYPPQITDETKGASAPWASRPAQVFRLPASHTLFVDAPVEPAAPYSDSTFILQAVAFISGTRLQFETWRVDGRIPLKSTLGAWVTADAQGHFVERAYAWWKALPAEHRIRAIKLFHSYNRAASAEWDWDVFSQQYAVFDGLYSLHSRLAGMKTDVGHRKRFELLTTTYDVPIDPKIIGVLCRARNDLFHEAI